MNPEPGYVKACRVLLLVLAGVVLLALAVPRRRAGLLLAAGGTALALPLLMLMCMVTLDAGTVSRAVYQYNQGMTMSSSVRDTDIASNMPWSEGTALLYKPFVFTRYNFVEGLEDTASSPKAAGS